MSFRIVQPWGPDKARQAMLTSEHATTAAAIAPGGMLATWCLTDRGEG